MIRKLSLKQFGRFSDREFDFAQTTVFAGANEAGKTTILDALLDTICAPKKSTSVGSLISRRYGDDRSASIDADDNLQNISTDEFLNLYAVHSGKTEIEYKDSKNWFDKVRASLFLRRY
jgi:predicted ATP-dependent endonuclease of OLD family